MTLQVNSVDTALKCTTDGLGRCSDTTDAVSIPAESFVRFTVVNPNGNAVGALMGWRSTL